MKNTQIKCKKCGQHFVVFDGLSSESFGVRLGQINDIEDSQERFEKLNDFIGKLIEFDYARGLHNAQCEIKLHYDGNIDLDRFEIVGVE